MLIRPPPMTNAERQRSFCERNPGYHARRKATQRARLAEEMRQQTLALQAEHTAVCREPLLLAAPVEAIVLPALDGAWREREMVCIER
jgi:hypothetical protein